MGSGRDQVIWPDYNGHDSDVIFKDGDGKLDLKNKPRNSFVKKVLIEETPFSEYRNRYLKSRIDDGTLVEVHVLQINPREFICGSRFVETLKEVGENVLKKDPEVCR